MISVDLEIPEKFLLFKFYTFIEVPTSKVDKFHYQRISILLLYKNKADKNIEPQNQ